MPKINPSVIERLLGLTAKHPTLTSGSIGRGLSAGLHSNTAQSLMNFATRHPLLTSAPILMGGYALGARTGRDPQQAARNAAIGAALAGAGLLAVPGLRTAFTKFLKRQGHALTGYAPKAAKMDPVAERTLKAMGMKAKKLSAKEKYWLSNLSYGARTNPEELARELTKYRTGTVTLPGILKGMATSPVQTIKKSWSHMSPKEKLITLGAAGYGISSSLKNPNEGEQAGGIAENLAFLATPAAPIGVWMPVSWAAHKLTSKLVNAKKRKEALDQQPFGDALYSQQPIPIPYKRPLARWGAKII